MVIAFVLFFALGSTQRAASTANQRSPSASGIGKEFMLAAETAIDDLDDIDRSSGEAVYSRGWDEAIKASDVLGRIASTDAERTVAKDMALLMLEAQTCHTLPLANNSSYHDCLDRESKQRDVVEEHLGRKRMSGLWQDLPKRPQ